MVRPLRLLLIVILSLGLAACPGPRRPGAERPQKPPVLKVEPGSEPWRVLPAQSLLRVLVYREGALASAGHNHVIASHAVTGTVYLHEDLRKSSLELNIPVDGFTVDEVELRRDAGPDFPPQVPESAKQGTRKNMLGKALLDAARYPRIKVISSAVRGTRDRAAVGVHIGVKDQWRYLIMPVELKIEGGRLTASGDIDLRQTDLGLQPFSVMMGALQVRDELKIEFTIVATAPPP